MANSDFVTSAKTKIRIGDVNADKPNSSAVNRKISGSINALIDASFYTAEGFWHGHAVANTFARLAPIYINKQCEIIQYTFSLKNTGSAVNNILNFDVYDNTGALVNTLFGTGANSVLINGNDITDVIVGRDVDSATTIAVNTASVTFQYGNLNLTTLNAGYYLIPKVEAASDLSLDKRLTLRLREL